MINVVTDKETYISGTYGKDKYNVPYTEDVYAEMQVLQKEADACTSGAEFAVVLETFGKVVASAKTAGEAPTDCGIPGVIMNPVSGKLHLDFGGGSISKLNFPKKLVDIMVTNRESQISNQAIVEMVAAFMFNPIPTQERLRMLGNYTTQLYVDKAATGKLVEEGYSQKVATERCTYFDLQITAHGFLKTSKVANEITEKWSIEVDAATGKPVMENGKPKKILVPRYATAYTVDEDSGEVTEVTKFPEYLEDRAFKPAIWSRSSGDDFFSGDKCGWRYEVGKLATLKDWDKVDMRDGSKHVRGLHVGGLSYVEMYHTGDRQLLDCFICPSKIGKFADEGLGEMTVLETFIYGCSTVEGTTKGLYHSSTYQEIRRASFEEILKERAAGSAEVKTEIDSKYNMLSGAFTTLDLVNSDGK